MNRILTALLMVGVLATSGCLSVKLKHDLEIDQDDWSAEGAGGLRQHRALAQIEPPLVEHWRYDAGAGVGPGGALIVDQVVLFGNRKGQVHALDLAIGKRIGRIRFDAPIEGSMIVSANRLFVPLGLDKKAVIGYDLKTGNKLWTSKGTPIEAGLAVDDEMVFAVDIHASVRALDAATGEERWSQQLDEHTGVVASPLVVDDLLVVADEDGVVYGLDGEVGRIRWRTTLNAPVFNTPSSDGRYLFVPTTRGRLYALEAVTGNTLWRFEIPDSTVRFTSPAFTPDQKMLVVGATDGLIRAFNAYSGELIWSTPLNGATIVAPLLASQTIYAATLRAGMLYALDTQTGSVVWSHEVTGRIKSAMATQDGKIIVMAETQQVIMFAPEIPEEVNS